MSIFITTNDIWNLENFRKPLLLQLQKSKHEIIVLTNFKKKIVNTKKSVKFYHINFQSNFNLFNDVINLIKIVYLFIKYRPSIALNFTIKPILLCSLASKFLNTISINTVTGFGNLYIGSRLFKFIIITFYKIFTSNKNYFFFHNKDDLKFFLKYKIAKKSKCFITKVLGLIPKNFKILNRF